MKKRFLCIGAAAVFAALCSCVIPYVGDAAKLLTANPKQNIYPLFYDFDPRKELDVAILNDLGSLVAVPVENTSVSLSGDFTEVGEKKGTVRYMGKAATFAVYVYDPNEPGSINQENPNGPLIIIEN